MTKVVMRKRGAGFVADEDEAFEVLARIPEGTRVVVEARQPRSLDQLHKWWKMMSILADNMPVIADKHAASDMVLVACHECDWRTDPLTGAMWPQARSIAFENMEEDAFLRLWRRAVYYIEANWIPIGTTRLQAEVDRFFHREEAASLGELVAA